MRLFTVLIITIFIISLGLTKAQNNFEQKIGIGASLQTTQYDIIIPIRLDKIFYLSPAISIKASEDIGNDILVGFATRFYLKDDKVSPYLGVKVGALINSPKSASSVTDYIAGIDGGAEYYIDSNFSIGIEGQLNFSISDNNSFRFGNPGKTNINTSTAIYAIIYF